MIEKIFFRFFIITSLWLFIFVQQGFSQNSRFIFNSARKSAIGGAHAALTDDFSTILNNPAGFRGVKSDFTVSQLEFQVTGPVSTIVSEAQDGELETLIGELGSTNIGLDMVGPLAMGKIDNDMAWGVFSVVDTNMFIPNLTQDAEITGLFDLGGVYGYSFGIDFVPSNSTMSFGILTKLFYRTEVNITKSFTEVIAALNDISTLYSSDSIPLGMGFGAGLDVGMKYIWNDTISVGLAVRDVYTALFMFNYASIDDFSGGGSSEFEYSSLPADYSLGILYTPHAEFFNGLLGEIKIMLDYNDIFDFLLDSEYATNMLLHFGVGAEFTIFDILILRLGMSEGLPSAGMGLDLHIFQFNFAMFGQELSTQPGLMSVYNIMVGIEFSY